MAMPQTFEDFEKVVAHFNRPDDNMWGTAMRYSRVYDFLTCYLDPFMTQDDLPAIPPKIVFTSTLENFIALLNRNQPSSFNWAMRSSCRSRRWSSPWSSRSFAEKAELTLIVLMIVGIVVITLSPRILWMHQTGLAILAVSTILQIAVSNLPKDADMKTSLVQIAIILCIIAAVFLIGIALVPALGQLGR